MPPGLDYLFGTFLSLAQGNVLGARNVLIMCMIRLWVPGWGIWTDQTSGPDAQHQEQLVVQIQEALRMQFQVCCPRSALRWHRLTVRHMMYIVIVASMTLLITHHTHLPLIVKIMRASPGMLRLYSLKRPTDSFRRDSEHSDL